jgi:hypothetical protein
MVTGTSLMASNNFFNIESVLAISLPTMETIV